jgi:hypothetical protein
MRVIGLLALALLLAGCERDWINAQHQRCHAMGGRGAYTRPLFECFASKKPFTFKFEINREVDFRRPGVTKIFEARYEG